MDTDCESSGHSDAGWSSQVARRAHNPKVVGSNPSPATKQIPRTFLGKGSGDLFFLSVTASLAVLDDDATALDVDLDAPFSLALDDQ